MIIHEDGNCHYNNDLDIHMDFKNYDKNGYMFEWCTCLLVDVYLRTYAKTKMAP